MIFSNRFLNMKDIRIVDASNIGVKLGPMLVSLEKLALSGTALTTLTLEDATNVPWPLPKLTEINLSGNTLNTVVFGDAPKLTKIDMTGNTLTQFTLGSTQELTSLDLSGHQLIAFGIGDSPKLTYLNLANNKVILILFHHYFFKKNSLFLLKIIFLCQEFLKVMLSVHYYSVNIVLKNTHDLM